MDTAALLYRYTINQIAYELIYLQNWKLTYISSLDIMNQIHCTIDYYKKQYHLQKNNKIIEGAFHIRRPASDYFF